MKRAAAAALLFGFLLAARWCHLGIVWPEETLPAAAAAQMAAGKTLYREAWFDKPPLLAATYLLWGAQSGWWLRVAGALHAWLACWLGYLVARDRWGESAGRWAAALVAFFLVFDFPATVTPLAADLLMLVPHLAAVWLASRGRPFWAGLVAGVAFQINAKGLFVLAACALWSWRQALPLLGGFAASNVVVLGWLASRGALADYYQQVWWWSGLYAKDTFVENPLRHGAVRTLSWLGFHAAIVLGAFETWRRDPDKRWMAWALLSLGAAALGLRFFPRYYFQALPVFALAAAPVVAKRKWLLVLLLVPLVRFGPRYADLARNGDAQWADTAMDRDSREVSRRVRAMAKPGDTLFVWGFRAEIFGYTRLPAGTRFLECQPLTGVAADRHLFDTKSLMPEQAAAHRRELALTQPTFVLDGLGLYNPRLAIGEYEDLRGWLSQYREAGRSGHTIIYRREGTAP